MWHISHDIPVSYTHLDVYKRQAYYSAEYALFMLAEEDKALVPQVYQDKMAALKTLIDGEDFQHNAIEVSAASYNTETAELALTLANGEQLAALDLTRLSFNFTGAAGVSVNAEDARCV